MKRMAIAIGAVFAFTVVALADAKPSDAEAAKIKEALNAWGCQGGEYEKETEATGVFEIDDAKCKDGQQYDFKLDANYKVIVITRD